MSKANIVLIEPDLILGATYRNFLIEKGFDVILCNDGQDAIDVIDKNPPDLIILELQLTAHNGYEFLYELRSYKEWFSIPVIINSLIPESKTKLARENLQNLGVVGYLYKSTTSLAKLNNFIENHILITQI
jgi:DNA-binding response OmpR family regulator